MLQYTNINLSTKIFISKTFKLKFKSTDTRIIKLKTTESTASKWTRTADQIKTDIISEEKRIKA